jgi:hypothetical protein
MVLTIIKWKKIMNNKLLLAMSLSVASFSASSSPLFDVPLGKKCYAVYQKLVKIQETQTVTQCINKLSYAASYTESASLRIAEDDNYYSKNQLESAINALRHAQVYGCTEEDKIVEAEKELADIKAQLK